MKIQKKNLNVSNTYDSFTMANSNSLFESQGNYFRPKRETFMDCLGNVSYFIIKCMFYVQYILESPHRGNFNEYTHTIIVYKIEKTPLN